MIPKLCDAHTHYESLEELQTRSRQKVFSLLCAATSREYGFLEAHLAAFPDLRPWVMLTAGLHPWHCEEEPAERMLALFPKVDVVGEIGLDSVWCKVSLELQREVFIQQLACAAKLGKPVILHTKGQEAGIAGILKEYPNRYLVHWYSCDSFSELYEDLDCYFTIGPDVPWNETTREIVRTVRPDRLLLETDGMASVRWADRKGGLTLCGEGKTGAREALLRSLSCCAQILQKDPEELELLFCRNLKSFLQLPS